jgi:hypothetical protein
MSGAEQAVRAKALALLAGDAALTALVGVGGAVDDAAAGRIEAVVAGLRGAADGWSVVSARVVRTRFGFVRDGGWRHEVVVRCRCLAD